jgi:hypothetical protein
MLILVDISVYFTTATNLIMKQITHLATVLLFIVTSANAQSTTDTLAVKFAKLVADNNMEFTVPAGTKPVPLVKNMRMHYE